VAIPGAKTPDQVTENLGAASAAPLTPEEIDLARRLYAKDFGL